MTNAECSSIKPTTGSWRKKFLALAVLCNKTLFPNRIPNTIALTPPAAGFLERGKIIKKNV
ncbi:hypothetical protein RHGRI_000858 [Rhododendron griersonianum]|uniref:Uncharacterized protein n=1 Tax=Rhododendron griersonianum TaxID=479676 RepID=A0AAV6LI51_9ERIC|nr:hypothetical protein RHGRI_000858 [Rhododendron griersonianum]